MKKLISIQDVEKLAAAHQTECVITPGTIITPAAVDLAEEKGIRLVESSLLSVVEQQNGQYQDSSQLNERLVQCLLQLCEQPALLQTLMGVLETTESEMDLSRFQQYDHSFLQQRTQTSIGMDGHRLRILKDDTSGLEAGILLLTDEKVMNCPQLAEIQLVLSGTVKTLVDGRYSYSEPNDVLWLPQNTQVQQTSAVSAKVFYVRIKNAGRCSK